MDLYQYLIIYIAICAVCFCILKALDLQLSPNRLVIFFASPLIIIAMLTPSLFAAMSGWRIYFLVAGLILIVSALSACGEHEDAVAQSKNYCEMVATYKHTGGQYGWPAFRGEGECRGN